MKDHLKIETERLRRSWSRYDHGTLSSYLVQDVEDPRINVQSILTRHFLVRHLFANKFDELIQHELRFALVVNWVLALLKRGGRSEQLHAILDALTEGETNADGIPIPQHISETFSTLEFPNYVSDLLMRDGAATEDVPIPSRALSTFEQIWSEVLQDEMVPRISVVEPACGSANDYRFINSFGIARLIDYTGLDLCPKNIHNARTMFPDIRFHVGNAIEIDAPDHSFDCCFAHDLFEHLSLDAMQVALAEVLRVTRVALCLSFFNMTEAAEHIEQPVREYHWNKLSLPRLKALIEPHASRLNVIHVDTFLQGRFGYPDTHNKNAYTLIVSLR
jgi:hypothetical protein